MRGAAAKKKTAAAPLAVVAQAVQAPQANDNVPEYVTDVDLEARTTIQRCTWQTWRLRGKGPPYYKVSRRCLYKWNEVKAWLDAQQVLPKAS